MANAENPNPDIGPKLRAVRAWHQNFGVNRWLFAFVPKKIRGDNDRYVNFNILHSTVSTSLIGFLSLVKKQCILNSVNSFILKPYLKTCAYGVHNLSKLVQKDNPVNHLRRVVFRSGNLTPRQYRSELLVGHLEAEVVQQAPEVGNAYCSGLTTIESAETLKIRIFQIQEIMSVCRLSISDLHGKIRLLRSLYREHKLFLVKKSRGKICSAEDFFMYFMEILESII